MKTPLQNPQYERTLCRLHNKTAAARIISRKPKSPVYQSLSDFLNQFPIAAVNEYGEQIISGRRIC
jgi:hypothetical protein